MKHSTDGTATATVTNEAVTQLVERVRTATESATKETDNVESTITIMVDSGRANKSVEVSIPTEVVSAAAEVGTNLKVVSGTAEITLGMEAAANVSKAAGENAVVRLEIRQTGTEALPETVRHEMAEADLVELNLYVGGDKVSHFGGKVTVSIPYTLKDASKGISVYHIADDGTKALVPNAHLVNGNVIFDTEHFSHYAIVEDAWINPFTDIRETDWYFDAVRNTTRNGLFAGTSNTTFSPNATMTRAMLMTVLARADGQDPAIPEGGKWYDAGMKWAVEQGISDGTSPNGNITREQLATMLWRYAGSPETAGTLVDFIDANTAGSYATDALEWAVEQGIITGKGGGILDPKGNATRSQVAVMLMRFLQGDS